MRSIYYMKLDYVLTKQQMRTLPVVALVGVLVGKGTGGGEGGIGALVACSYLLFIASTFSTSPFGSGQREAGFLLMLPGTIAQRVAGRFLYGLSFVGLAVAGCVVFLGMFSLMGYEVTPATIGLLLCNTAACLLIVTFEYLISYVFGAGKSNWLYLSNIVRIGPSMAMFFGFMFVLEKMDQETYVMDRVAFLTEGIVSTGLLALAAVCFIMVIAMVICVKVIEKRDYV